MKTADLEALQNVPFLFWAKDRDGKYMWGNRAINQLANENVVGKTDGELVWADDAERLRAADKKVFESGAPSFVHESVDKSSRGKAMLSVCKWLDELDGEQRCFGVSFVIG